MCCFLFPFLIHSCLGSLYWKCVLAHDVRADECLYKQMQKRIELRMRKAAPLHWTHYESMEGSFEDEASESSDSYDSASAIFGPPPADNTATGSPSVSESSNDLGVGMGIEVDNNTSGQGGLDNHSNLFPDLNSLSINQKPEGRRFESATDPGSDSTPALLRQSLGSGSGVGVVGGGDSMELERGTAEDCPPGVSVCGTWVWVWVWVCAGVGGCVNIVHVRISEFLVS